MPEWLNTESIALLLSVAANVALWRRDEKRQDRVLEAFKDGADSQNSIAATIESLEASIGALQRDVHALIDRCHGK